MSGPFCVSCGKPLRTGSKFCGACGSPVEDGDAAHEPSRAERLNQAISDLATSNLEFISKQVFLLIALRVLNLMTGLLRFRFDIIHIRNYGFSIISFLITLLTFFIFIRISLSINNTLIRRSVFWLSIAGIVMYVILVFRPVM